MTRISFLPGFSGDAVEWLLGERDIAGLGTECIDVELGWKTKNEVKLKLAAANRVSLVQLANLAQLPPTGIEITVAPLKLSGGSGGPARVFAVSGVRNGYPKYGHHREDEYISAQSYLNKISHRKLIHIVI